MGEGEAETEHCLRYRLKALPGLLHAFYGSLHDARRGDLEVTQDCDSCRLPMERKVGGTFCLGKRGDWKAGGKVTGGPGSLIPCCLLKSV